MRQDPLLPGSVFGGVLLIAGSCIGAGMLALPLVTGLAGFFPSLLMLLLCWALMTFTGLLLVEISGWFYGQVNLLSMTEESRGWGGRWVGWISYLFLFYSLLVAYIAASGSIFSAILESLFHIALPFWVASLLFTAFFGYIIYLGTRPVDLINRLLMVGLIVAYFGMIALGIFRINPKLLLHWAPSYLLLSPPILVTSFGFQNMVPSLTAYMKGDLLRTRRAVLGGSLLALGVYFVWSFFVLGLVPFEGKEGLLETYGRGEEVTRALSTLLGPAVVTFFTRLFALFAIITSFLAQGLALTHFLADGFKVSPKGRGKLFVLAAIVPSLLFALYRPGIFIKALSLAGGLFAMIILGILPVLMAWVGRYRDKRTSNYHVAGGKSALTLALFFSLFIIYCELFY